jgi:hypothetical protein
MPDHRTAVAILLALVAVALIPAGAAAKVPAPPHAEYVYAIPEGWTGPFTAAAAGTTIYINPRGVDRYTLEHERGHVFDYLVLTDADRAYFTRLMRLRGPWTQQGEEVLGQWAGGGRSPDEWFADWYANARLGCGPSLGRCWTTGYAESPMWDRQFRRFLRRLDRSYAVWMHGGSETR